MIIADDDDGRKAVLLGGGSGLTEIEGTDPVAFTRWQIVAGHEPAVVMYQPVVHPRKFAGRERRARLDPNQRRMAPTTRVSARAIMLATSASAASLPLARA